MTTLIRENTTITVITVEGKIALRIVGALTELEQREPALREVVQLLLLEPGEAARLRAELARVAGELASSESRQGGVQEPPATI